MSLERKFAGSPEFKAAYDAVIHENLEKGYLSPAPLVDSGNRYPVLLIKLSPPMDPVTDIVAPVADEPEILANASTYTNIGA
ncbi:unnamed protein product, partial [Iphiclides podalirius]